MAYDFIDVVNGFSRMCKMYDSYCDVHECPIASLIDTWEKEHKTNYEGCSCLNFARECPKEFEEAIINWCMANPAPIYPTIGEVVKKLCTLMNIDPRTCCNTIYDERLTEEVANYFNIKPINDCGLVK